jgi:DNA-binding NarL/FixJ family response regulator
VEPDETGGGRAMIGVLIVNRSRLICDVVAAVLRDEPDIRVVGSATSVGEALDLLRRSKCDLVLASTNLSNEGTLEFIRAAKAASPARVLVMGLVEAEEVILRYVEAGADGYVLREDSVDGLLKNIRAVHDGEALASPEITAALFSRIAELAESHPKIDVGEFAELTPREKEVLDLVGEGFSNREIANRLFIEVGTVKNHVHNILHKLDVGSRDEAAAYWDAIQES